MPTPLGIALISVALSVLVAPSTVSAGPPEVADSGYLEGAGGVRLFYRVVGSEDPTVVAVHGGPGAGMNAFYPDLVPLARDHRVIFYDQRGGGRSGLPEDEGRLDASWFVADLEAVRGHFGLERMNLVAHSFGAVLVARYAEEHPDRIARLALLGATGPQRTAAAAAARSEHQPAPREDRQALREVMTALLEGSAEDPVAACRRYEALLAARARAAGEPEGWQGSTCEAPPEAVAYYYAHTAQVTPRSFGDWDFTSGLDTVAAPVLVVTGELASARDQQRAWASAYPNGRLLLVPEAASTPVATHPTPVLDALHSFFSGSWPEAAERPD